MNGVIGQPLPRKEDFRLLTGNGRYTDDINLEGQVYAYFVRSPHAHAQLGAIDTSAAAALPGVLSVMTGEDYQADGMAAQGRVAAIPTDILQPDKPGLVPRPGTQALATPYFPLAVGKVRRVGECVAVCIAETPDRAKDGAELVKIDYQALPPVVDLEAAVADDAPQLWEHAPGNVVLEVELGDKPATDRAFAGAPVASAVAWHRLPAYCPHPLTPGSSVTRLHTPLKDLQ